MKKKTKLFSITKNDFTIQTFRCGGKGGQNVNKRNTGVRIIHDESGCRGESREHRTQAQNRQAAFRRLATDPTFRAWIKTKAYTLMFDLERRVSDAMQDRNIKIEYYRAE